MKILLNFSAFLLISFSCMGQSTDEILDNVKKYRSFASDVKLSDSLRIYYGKRAVLLSKKLEADTLILKSSKILSYTYLTTGNYEDFGNINRSNFDLANKLKDTLAIATASSNIGWYEYQIKDNTTEAYTYYINALEKYSQINNLRQKAISLIAIATIQDDEKDYLRSQQNAIESIKILNKLDYDGVLADKYVAYNLLGLTSYKLNKFDKSIDYHTQAYELTRQMENGYFTGLESKNNLALPYRAKQEYDTALNIYKNLVNNLELKKYDISFYSLIIGNYAFTKFLSGNYDFDDLEKEFKKSLSISDSINDQFTRLAASIDLAKFYKANDVKDLALTYANQSYQIANEIGVYDLYLESILLLADLNDVDKSNKYLREHIKLSDSLLEVERSVRDKFARIEFETEELEAENEQISKDRLYLALLSIGLILTAILIYIVITQRVKNKELKLFQTQQKANEDIYNLMLVQQDKIDEARAKEKMHVSKELHDGVLGRLFGTRLSLDSINFKDGKEAILTRAKYINQLKVVEDEIRKISHNLNTDFVAGSGFMDIVTELIENQTQAYNLTYKFNFTDDISWDLVSNKTKINIYRIIQESMQNIYKHANAKHIEISISLKNNVICLDIADDGDGFDTTKNRKGIGLKNMSSRVEDINGTIDFSSQSGNGTVVKVRVPYRNQIK